MTKFIILVSLLWLNPTEINHTHFQITYLNDKPLNFYSTRQCLAHVAENVSDIRAYISAYHEGRAVVNKIMCIPDRRLPHDET